MIEVAAAIIWDKNKLLICKRPSDKANPDLWEFAGGKVEQGETKEQALIRECREELDIKVSPKEVFMEVTHKYPDNLVHLTFFNTDYVSGTPKLLVHTDMRWITPAELDNFTFCPADKEILAKIKEICRT